MATQKKLSFLLVLNILCLQRNQRVISQRNVPKGHLKPLGEHKLPESIEERSTIPTPLEFWQEYVSISKPVVLRGAGKSSKAFKLWTDEYLKTNYGDLEVRLESKGEKSGRVPIGAKGLGRDTIGMVLL